MPALLPKNKDWQPVDLLSKKQLLDYLEFLDDLNYLEMGLPFLATIGINTTRLGDAILKNIKQHLPHCYLEKDKLLFTENLYQLFDQYATLNQPIILPIFQQDIPDLEMAAQQLLWHRDIITRKGLNLIVLVSKELYETINVKAYDFISYSNVNYNFADLLAQVEADLTPYPEKTSGEEEYEVALAELAEYLEEEVQEDDVLLRMYIQVNSHALITFRIKEANTYLDKILELINVVNNNQLLTLSFFVVGYNYFIKGEWEKALFFYIKNIAIYEEFKLLTGKFHVIEYIGGIYQYTGQLTKALDLYQQALRFYENTNYSDSIDILNKIGSLYKEKGNLEKALKFYIQSMNLNNKEKQINTDLPQLSNIGLIYFLRGNLKKAFEYCRKALFFNKKAGFLSSELYNLTIIGEFYRTQGDLSISELYFSNILSQYQQVKGVISQKAIILYHISIVLKKQGNLKEAQKKAQKALNLISQTDFPIDKSKILFNLASIHRINNELKQATNFYKQALALQEKIGLNLDKATTLGEIALVHQTKGNLTKAKELLQQALKSHQEMGYVLGEATHLKNLGNLFLEKKDITTALDYFQKAIKIFRQLENLEGIAETLKGIALVYQAQNKTEEAKKMLNQAHQIAKVVGLQLLEEEIVQYIENS